MLYLYLIVNYSNTLEAEVTFSTIYIKQEIKHSNRFLQPVRTPFRKKLHDWRHDQKILVNDVIFMRSL